MLPKTCKTPSRVSAGKLFGTFHQNEKNAKTNPRGGGKKTGMLDKQTTDTDVPGQTHRYNRQDAPRVRRCQTND